MKVMKQLRFASSYLVCLSKVTSLSTPMDRQATLQYVFIYLITATISFHLLLSYIYKIQRP